MLVVGDGGECIDFLADPEGLQSEGDVGVFDPFRVVQKFLVV